MENKRKKLIIRISVILVAILFFLYITGLITQLMLQFIFKSDIVTDFNMITCIGYAFDFEKSRMILVIELLLVGLILVTAWKYSDKKMGMFGVAKGDTDPDRNISYSQKGIYGTARKMNIYDIKQEFNVYDGFNDEKVKEGAIVFGYIPNANQKKKAIVGFPKEDYRLNKSYNRNVTVIGPPGSGKSRKYVINQIIQTVLRGESCVVTDTKGEIYGITSEYARANGYEVVLLNLCELANSDGWDMLGEVKDDPSMADMLVNTVIENTGGIREFWDKAEKNIFKAVILLKSIGDCDIDKPANKERSTMGDVYKFIATKSLDDMKNIFEALKAQYPYHPAILPYMTAMRSEEQKKGVLGDVLHGLASRLEVFQNEQLCRVTGHKDIDFERLGKRKCIYYLRFSDQDTTYKLITSSFFAMMFKKTVALADSLPTRRLPVPINLILDEFVQIGQIPEFDKKLSSVRSRGINISIIIQNIPQLMSTYDNLWEILVEDCDLFLVLGVGNGTTTAEFISKLTGETTVMVSSNSVMLGEAGVRKTDSTGQTYVYTPHQIRTMNPSHFLLIVKGKNVLELEKIDYTDNPESQKAIFAETNVTAYRGNVDVYSPNFSDWSINKEVVREPVRKNDDKPSSRTERKIGAAEDMNSQLQNKRKKNSPVSLLNMNNNRNKR